MADTVIEARGCFQHETLGFQMSRHARQPPASVWHTYAMIVRPVERPCLSPDNTPRATVRKPRRRPTMKRMLFSRGAARRCTRRSWRQRRPNRPSPTSSSSWWMTSAGRVSVYGGTVTTPRIDALAREGMRLNNYTVEAQCTPSQAALYDRPPTSPIRYDQSAPTGRWQVRAGARGKFTLGELFSGAGYATALIGKWHLGEDRGPPADRSGFRRVVRHQEQLQ